ncbi:hypothetical protein ACIA5D_06715 [Actinoplanes sp. NPDC051513]|uniref:hypothetical protein n=1 Tax=Actinoplanes sp. NPDC051513 TaxID=3363908 RepID=UPI0037B9A9B5
MINEGRRPTALAGFWTLLVGGAAIVLLLLFLHPITQQSDCPNYGGNGNASAFTNPAWDLLLPLILLAWIVAIAFEQALPSTRRGRSGPEIAARAAIALILPAVGSCWLFLAVATLCH